MRESEVWDSRIALGGLLGLRETNREEILLVNVRHKACVSRFSMSSRNA